MTPERSLSSALLFVADDLERRGYMFSGVIQRAARAVVELERQSQGPGAARTCPQCGEEVEPVSGGPTAHLLLDALQTSGVEKARRKGWIKLWTPPWFPSQR